MTAQVVPLKQHTTQSGITPAKKHNVSQCAIAMTTVILLVLF